MPEENEYNPIPQSTLPSTLTLLDIIKIFNNSTGKEFSTRLTNLNDFLSPYIEPTFAHVVGSPYSNEELGAILTTLARQTLLNSQEIIYTKHLIALLTLELIEQGVKIEDKELIENLEIYNNK